MPTRPFWNPINSRDRIVAVDDHKGNNESDPKAPLRFVLRDFNLRGQKSSKALLGVLRKWSAGKWHGCGVDSLPRSPGFQEVIAAIGRSATTRYEMLLFTSQAQREHWPQDLRSKMQVLQDPEWSPFWPVDARPQAVSLACAIFLTATYMISKSKELDTKRIVFLVDQMSFFESAANSGEFRRKYPGPLYPVLSGAITLSTGAQRKILVISIRPELKSSLPGRLSAMLGLVDGESWIHQRIVTQRPPDGSMTIDEMGYELVHLKDEQRKQEYQFVTAALDAYMASTEGKTENEKILHEKINLYFDSYQKWTAVGQVVGPRQIRQERLSYTGKTN